MSVSKFISLTKRNMMLYFRDKGSVFFSMLSTLIVIFLMLLFLGEMNTDSITELLAKLPFHDTADDEANAKLVVFAWTAAGVIPVNALMVTLCVFSTMVKDKTTGKICSVYTAPINRTACALSYITAACLCSVIVCSITLALSEIFLCVNGAAPYTFAEHIRIIGMIIVCSFSFSAVTYLLGLLSKNDGAWSGMGMLLGTLSGFFGGIYFPVGQLSEGVRKIIECTPVIYSTVMFRSVMVSHTIEAAFADAPAEMVEGYRSVMGIDMEAFGHSISPAFCIMTVLCTGIVFAAAGALANARLEKKDR